MKHLVLVLCLGNQKYLEKPIYHPFEYSWSFSTFKQKSEKSNKQDKTAKDIFHPKLASFASILGIQEFSKKKKTYSTFESTSPLYLYKKPEKSEEQNLRKRQKNKLGFSN